MINMEKVQFRNTCIVDRSHGQGMICLRRFNKQVLSRLMRRLEDAKFVSGIEQTKTSTGRWIYQSDAYENLKSAEDNSELHQLSAQKLLIIPPY